MNAILQDLSTSNLVAAIEDNLFSLMAAFCKWPRAEVHDGVEIKWSMTDIPFPLFNSIMRAQLAPEKIDATIQSIVSEAKSRNVPLLWWIGPSTQPADLGRHLEGHGFVGEGQMPGMAVNLANLNENLPTPSGLTVQRVTDDETLKQWSQICALGFEMPDFVADATYDSMRYVDSDTDLAYLGWQNGRPVATALAKLVAGVVGIYNIVTIPEARRQGIGAAMTLTPLREARDRNYKAGILLASEMGEGVYRSLGFQEYCKIGQYVWSPEHKQDAG
jgi:GNAT superfamily N-acetyltransferase